MTRVRTLLNPERFRRWLEQRPHTERYGRGSIDGCPVARYVRDVTGEPAEVGQGWMVIGAGPQAANVHPPDWVDAFVMAFDRGRATNYGPRKALAILDEVNA